ncbi:MAG: anaerobic ribonucleoside-triphosphate reductase activating protein [Acholeplasmatales bacterium]|jgi:anaerobic ribonucleoside-triphosphate reductase activating protein|nr:anaerobic ribonucleoside-triphosphate reductase activating protein [Acholeplasmatales bacterium]
MMPNEAKFVNELNTYKIHISGFVKESIVDGFGLRYVIFTQGCLHECLNCHNKHTWSLDGGYLMDTHDIINDFDNYPLIEGITLSGGEPFLQPIQCNQLAIEAHKKGLNVLVFSGYTYEEILLRGSSALDLLKNCDYLIDGPYLDNFRTLDLAFRGSSNQRIIDLNKTREAQRLIVIDEFKNILL